LDWVAIESAYKKSTESVREIAARKGVSHVAILKRAREEGWGSRPPGARKAPPKAGNQSAELPKSVTSMLKGAMFEETVTHQRGNQARGNEAIPSGVKLPVIIRQWVKNRQEVAQVCLDQYKGHPTLDCRSWYRDVASGQLKPSPKGWTLPLAQAADLAVAINDAIAKAQELGLLPKGEGK
jgi:hypothetical protein